MPRWSAKRWKNFVLQVVAASLSKSAGRLAAISKQQDVDACLERFHRDGAYASHVLEAEPTPSRVPTMGTKDHGRISCDIALIHPPHVLITEEYETLPLPWNLNMVGSSLFVGKYPVGPDWRQRPIGYTTMKRFFETNTPYSIRIINLAATRAGLTSFINDNLGRHRMSDRSVIGRAAETISSASMLTTLRHLDARIYAVDLHWLVHAPGALQVLKFVKQFHPRSMTVLGGFTASYFSHEIMSAYPFIDFLIVGDGCVPLAGLIEAKGRSDRYKKIPNLLYRKRGTIEHGPRRHLSDFRFAETDDYLFHVIPTARGCPLQCITCGGSRYSSKATCGYTSIDVYSVDSIMMKLSAYARNANADTAPYLIHDPLLTLGRRKWRDLLREIRASNIDVSFVIEFFAPHSKEEIRKIAHYLPGSSINLSPETMDPVVRAHHKNLKYSNAQLIMNLDVINDCKDLSFCIWFMAGLAGETRNSVDANLDFIRRYYRTIHDKQSNVIKYSELMHVDPGSLAYEHPEKYGYLIDDKSLVAQVSRFELPIFKYHLNYVTRLQTREQLFRSFMRMHDGMNAIYYENGLIDERLYRKATRYNDLLVKYSLLYDAAVAVSVPRERIMRFAALGERFLGELAAPKRLL